MVKLLIGGSPCTYWSIAQTKNRETVAEGIGWELFLNYRIARDKYQPDYFLYENNKSMSPAIRTQITAELGVEPVLINSALVSAQNRQRLYWVGKRNPDGTYSQVPVEQPEDRGILLRDILETGIAWQEKAYNLTTRCCGAIPSDTLKRHRHTMIAEPIRIGTIENDEKKQDFDSQQYRVYSPDGKSITLCGNGGGAGGKTGLYAIPISETTGDRSETLRVYKVRDGKIRTDGREYPIKLADGFYIIRKLTVTECKRLQTVPDTYTFPVSNAQAYKMLGNGWTVDVISHIMSHFDFGKEPVAVLSMYDGMSCGRIALKKLGVEVGRYYATEIDKYAIKTTMHNYPDTIQLGDAFAVRTDTFEGVLW